MAGGSPFVDQALIAVKAGRGGNGCRSFYTDMWNTRGFPDGGDGGRGADIILRADRNLRTLLDFKYNRHFQGRHGGHGSSKGKKGFEAPAVHVRVPVGTTVTDSGTGCILSVLDSDRQELIVARGGAGGRGNRKNREATQGGAGEERQVLLDLTLIADVGVIGFPNAGKSTLITALTNATPQIAAYPFTTKYPILGVAGKGADSFVIADIPGLIEGSSKGKGLGDRFLRHVNRTEVLLHLIDMGGSEGRDPLEDYRVINRELKAYDPALAKKPQVLAANKMDLEPAARNLARFKKAVRKKIFPISALERKGLDALLKALREKVNG
ncbi:MAG: Obg family GTPase CgtA [Deltaproteobacteria bacterium]